MNFKSDNMCPVSEDIINAIHKANHGTQNSYGADEYSLEMQTKFSKIFEKNVKIFLVSTGTAANSLALSTLVKPYELIACHKNSHINTDECGAPILFTGGANLLLIEGKNGKIDTENLSQQLEATFALKPRKQKPGCISITQATEQGTVYSINELQSIAKIAKHYKLPIHMDGARFANSLITLGCTAAEATWKSGIDVMSFGGTKNGCLNAEAIIFFNEEYSQNFEYLHKRAGQTISKTRFFASQFIAYFEKNLWLNNATIANEMAKMLKSVFEKAKIKIAYPVEANEIFCIMNDKLATHMTNSGCNFYPWSSSDYKMYRFVTSCFTTKNEIESVKQCLENFKN